MLGKLQALKDRLDFGNEGVNFCSEIGIIVGGTKKSRNFSPMRYLRALSVQNSASIPLTQSMQAFHLLVVSG